MQEGGGPIRMRLKKDLTAYHPNAKVGALCTTLPNVKMSMWGSQDHFVAVRFDDGGSLDVTWKGLERVAATAAI